jgi:lipopolysaccharide/colanic/teichoic acid biosynthesis glycosyltransferase
MLDVVLSLLGLVVLSPLLIVIAVWIKLDSPGPTLYRQVRVGKGGVPFRIRKFRSMAVGNADTPQLTVAGAPRITRSGALLRRYKLDELPQLVDVLLGNMSLVGPRPEVPQYVEYYPPDQRVEILSVRPGMTDLAAIEYRHENDILAQSGDAEREYIDRVLPIKVQYYQEYVDTHSVPQDLKIIMLTLKALFSK